MAWTVDGNSYTQRAKIDIQYANVDSDLTDFPLLVRIAANATLGAATNADGHDVRFTSAAGTLLDYERESHVVDAGELTAIYWVRVPAVSSSGDTTIYLYHRSADTTDGANAGGVWDANYLGVWHMDDTGDESDSSGNGETLTETSGTIPTATGKIGLARDFVAADTEYLEHADGGSTDISGADQPITVSAWVTRDVDSGAVETIVSKYLVTGNQRSYLLGLDASDKGIGIISYNGTDSSTYAYGATEITANSAWRHVALVYNDTDIRFYLDGALNSNGENNPKAHTAGIYGGTATFKVGSRDPSNYWDGLIDEVRVCNDARSAAEIKFEYANVNEADNELTWDYEEASTTSSTTSSTATASTTSSSTSTTATASTSSSTTSTTTTSSSTTATASTSSSTTSTTSSSSSTSSSTTSTTTTAHPPCVGSGRYAADSVTLDVGTSTEDVTDLQMALDGSTYHIDEVTGTPGIDLIVDFVDVRRFDYVHILGYYLGGADHSVSIQLYNWISATWDTWDSMDGVESTLTNHGFFLPCSGNYVGTGGDAGEVRVRFNHTKSGNASHDLYLDVVSLYDRYRDRGQRGPWI